MAKKTVAKTTVKKTTPKKTTEKKPPTKNEIITQIAEKTELNKKQVAAVLDELTAMIGKNLSPRGPGEFKLPGLAKITVRKKPAQPKRMMKRPGTDEMMEVGPKPASKVIKIRPLKDLKEMV
jgi:nucleoid DNA-binding protein